VQVPVAVYLVRAKISCQQELEVKMKVWIVSNPPVLRSVVLTGVLCRTALQLPLVVGVQLVCLPYHVLKARLPGGLWRNAEISAQAAHSVSVCGLGSSMGLICAVLDPLLPSRKGDRVVSVRVIFPCLLSQRNGCGFVSRAVVWIYLPVSE